MTGLSGGTSENGSETFGSAKGRKLYETLVFLVLNGVELVRLLRRRA
jgi:hypothetical protein